MIKKSIHGQKNCTRKTPSSRLEMIKKDRMITQCDGCGRTVSDHFLRCLVCNSSVHPRKNRAHHADMSSFFEDFSPHFERRVIG